MRAPLTSVGVPGDHPEIEQADPGAQLLAGDLGALGRRTYGVVELECGRPTADTRAGRASALICLVGLAVVQQHQVDVGAGSELLPGQAADRGQRDAGRRAAGIGVQLDQRRLDALGDQTPTIRPCRGFPPGPDRDVETLAG